MKYKIYQEVLITRTVIVEDMEKDGLGLVSDMSIGESQ
jgi:hypothetical protein